MNTGLRRRLISLFLVFVWLSYSPALAQTVSASAAQSASGHVASSVTGGSTGSSTPSQLILNSSSQSMSTAGILNQTHTTQSSITVGGVKQIVTAASLLSPAEYVALEQVLFTGHQGLGLNSLGQAVSGTFSLSSITKYNSVANLVIPQGVIAVDTASRNPTVSISGSLTNYGTVLSVSNNPQISTATISASSISNQSGGLITSVLPSAATQSPSSVSVLNLNLNASSNILNSGTISSSGNLSLTAGGSISNLSSSSTRALIQAAGTINLSSGTGSIINSGLINAVSGNVNVNTLQPTDLVINNAGGTIQALLGNINLRSSDYAGSNNLSITGGDWLSQNLNLNGGAGTIQADVDNVSGVMNTTAAQAHFFSESSDLVMGGTDVSGDPTFYNQGNITIASPIDVGADLAILASGNITTTSTVTQISSNSGGTGHDIQIVAGALLVPNPCVSCSPSATTPATTSVTVQGASTTGGNIDFTQSPALTLNSNSTTSNLSGGNITLVAYQGTSSNNNGNISLPAGSQINAGGNGSGNNGNVTVIAGGNGGIALGKISTISGTGAAAGTGIVSISNAQPTTNNSASTCPGCAISFNTLGAVTTGNFFVAGPTMANGTTILNGRLQSSGDLEISSTNLFIDANANAEDINVSSSNGLSMNVNAITLTATNGNITVENSGNGSLSLTNSNATLTSTDGAIVISNTGSGSLSLQNLGSTMSAATTLTIENSGGTGLDILNVSGARGASQILAPNSVTISNSGGDISINNIGSEIAATGNGGQLNISNSGGNVFVFNNTDSSGNAPFIGVTNIGTVSVSTDQDIIINGNGTIGISENTATTSLNLSSTNGSIFLGQQTILPGDSLNVNLSNANAAMMLYANDGTTFNINLTGAPPTNPLATYADPMTLVTTYILGASSWFDTTPSGKFVYLIAGSGSSFPTLLPNGTLSVSDIGNLGSGQFTTFINILDPTVANLGSTSTSGGNLYVQSNNPNGLSVIGNVDTTNGGSGGYAAFYAPASISVQGVSTDQSIRMMTGMSQSAISINGAINAGNNLTMLASVVAATDQQISVTNNAYLAGSGGLSLSLTGTNFSTTNGNISLANSQGDLSLWISNDIDNGNNGSVEAGANLNLTNLAGSLNINNLGTTIASANGNLNIIVGNGDSYLLNNSDSSGHSAFLGTQSNSSFGSITFLSNGNITAVGNGSFGTSNSYSPVDIGTSNGSLIFGQGSVNASAGLTLGFEGNLLLYSSNGTALSPQVLTGQKVSSITDINGVPVYYFGTTEKVLDTNGVIVLSTGSFGTPNISNTGILTIPNVTGNLVVSIRNDSNVSALSGLTNSTGSIYVENSGGSLNFNGDIVTSSPSGNSGNVFLYSPNFIDGNNITTSSTAAGSSGGAIRIFAPNSLQFNNLDASSYASSGLGNNGGFIQAISLSSLNLSNVNSTGATNAPSAGNVTGNGGNIILMSTNSFLGVGTVTSSTFGTSGNAGFIHIIGQQGVSTSDLIADANGNSGNGGAIYVWSNNGFVPSPSQIFLGNLDDSVVNNGNSGAILDTVSGTNGVTVFSNGSIFAGGITTYGGSAANNGTTGLTASGANVNLTGTLGSVSVTAIDSSSNGSFGNGNNAGNITVTAGGDITADFIYARGGYVGTSNSLSGNGGNIVMVSNASVNLQSGPIDSSSYSNAGNAGFIHVSASDGIATSDILARATGENGGNGGNSGAITLMTGGPTGNITTGDISNDVEGQGGNVGTVVDSISGLSGISLISSGTLLFGNINSFNASNQGNGGSVLLNAAGDITSTGTGISTATNTGTGGNVTASSNNGAINFGITTINTSSLNTAPPGGDAGYVYLSAATNITTGPITATANSLHSLNGGAVALNITGTSTGTIQINGLIATEGDIMIAANQGLNIASGPNVGNLALLAGGDLLITAGGNVTITSRDSTGQGHDMYLVAGAENVLFIPDVYFVTDDVGSNTGGNIILSQLPQLTLDTSSSSNCVGCAAGSIYMAAFNSGATTGQIALPPVTIVNTNSTTPGESGNLTMIAAAPSGTGISIGKLVGPAINPLPVTFLAGSLSLNNADPISTSGNEIIFDQSSGGILSSNTLAADPNKPVQGQTIITDSVLVNGDINLNTGNLIVEGPGLSSLGNINIFRPGAQDLTLSLNVSNIGSTIMAAENINITNNSDGAVIVSNSNNGSITAVDSLSITGNGFSMSVSNEGGTIQAETGTLSITNTAPASNIGSGLTLTNSSGATGIQGSISAAEGITISNTNGPMAIYNTGSTISAAAGNLDITNTGGLLYIVNVNDCFDHSATISATYPGTGPGTGNSMSITNTGDIIGIGNGSMGTADPSGKFNLTSTNSNGSIILGQGEVLAGSELKVSFGETGNLLLYSYDSSNPVNPTITSGQTKQFFFDPAGLKVFYDSGNGSPVLIGASGDTAQGVVLDTSGTAGATVSTGTLDLDLSDSTGNVVVSVRDSSTITSINEVVTNGGAAYVENTGSGALTVNGAMNTSPSSGSGAYLIGVSFNGLTTQGVTTAAVTNGNGGSVALISLAGDLTVNGSINTDGASAGFGNGGGGGSVLLTTLPGTGSITYSSITTEGVGEAIDYNGGSVTIITCASCTGGAITTSTENDSLFNDAGSINISAGGGTTPGNITVGALTANGNSAWGGHEISLLSGTGTITLNGDINSSAYTADFSGNAGFVHLSAATGITTQNIFAEADGQIFPSDGAAITLITTSSGGNISTLTLNNSVSTSGTAGAVYDGLSATNGITIISEGTVSTGDVTSSASAPGSSGSGGNVTVSAVGTANVGSTTIETSSFGDQGIDNNGGSVSINATGNITVPSIDARGAAVDGNGRGGNVALNSSGAGVVLQTTQGGTPVPSFIDTESNGTVGNLNNGGSISITSSDGITVPFISGSVPNGLISCGGCGGGNGSGGNISVTSTNGGITLATTINSASQGSGWLLNNGGNISITANGDITTNSSGPNSPSGGSLIADGGPGGGNGGAISVESSNGQINLNNSAFPFISVNGNGLVGLGGNVSMTAVKGIQFISINSNGGSVINGGGNVFLQNTGTGDITLSFVDTSANANSSAPIGSGNGGTITVMSNNSIVFIANPAFAGSGSDLRSNGGNAGGNGGAIALTATNGDLDVNGNGAFISSSADDCCSVIPNAGNGGTINITVGGSINGSNGLSITAGGGWSGGNGADIDIQADGSINTGGGAIGSSAPPLFSYSNPGTGSAGTLFVQAGGDITEGGFEAVGFLDGGNGGSITVMSGGQITDTAAVDSYEQGGDGESTAGAVIMHAVNGINISFGINASGITVGSGGSGNSITLTNTTSNDITVGGFISSAAQLNAGDITITNSGSGNITIGNAGPFNSVQAATNAESQAGNISMSAPNGFIDIFGSVDASNNSCCSPTVNAGFIDLSAKTSIDVTSFVQAQTVAGNGGAIHIATSGGSTANIFVSGINNLVDLSGTAGGAEDTVSSTTGIIVSAGGSVEIGTLNGSNISVLSTVGKGGGTGSGGNLTIDAGTTITLDGLVDISSYGNTGVGNNGGTIVMNAHGALTGVSLASQGGAGGAAGNGGSVTLTTTVDDVSFSGNINTSSATSGSGGFVHIAAITGITTGDIITSSATQGSGGAITLTTTGTNADIQSGNLFAAALGTGSGAAVEDTVSSLTGINITATGAVSAGHVDSTSASNGGTSGNGGLIDISSGGALTLSDYVDSSAYGTGTGGTAGAITLSAPAGLLVVLNPSGKTNAINATSTGAGKNAPTISITYGDATGADFIIDPSNATITSGVQGPIRAGASGTGNGGTININNHLGNVNITLNAALDTSSTGGSNGTINVNNPGTQVNITGNANGQLIGTVNASGSEVSIILNRTNTNLILGTVSASASHTSGDGVTLTVNHGTSSITVNDSVNSNDGTLSITTPLLTNNGTITGTRNSVVINSATVDNTGTIDSTHNGLVEIFDNIALLVEGAGTLNGNTIELNSTTSSVTATQDDFTGNLSGSAISNFTVESLDSDLNAKGTVNATTGTIHLTTDDGAISIHSASTLTAGTDILLNSSETISVHEYSPANPIHISAGQDVSMVATDGITITDESYSQGVNITSDRDTIIQSNNAGVTISDFSNDLISIGAGRDITVTGQTAISITDTSASAGVSLIANRNATITSNASTVSIVDLESDQGIFISGGVLSGLSNPSSLNLQDYNYSAFTTPGSVMVSADGGNLTVDGDTYIQSLGGSLGLVSSAAVSIAATNNFGELFAQGGNLWISGATSVTIGTDVTSESINSVARLTGGGVVNIGHGYGVNAFQGGGLAIYAGIPVADFNALLTSLLPNRAPPGPSNLVVDPGVITTGTQLVLQTTLQPSGNLINFPYVQFKLTLPNGSAKVGAGISVTNSPVFNINGGIVSIDPGSDINSQNGIFNVIAPPIFLLPAETPQPPIIVESAPPPPPEITPPESFLNPIILPIDSTRAYGPPTARTELADEVNSLAVPELIAADTGDYNLDTGWVYVCTTCQPFYYRWRDSILLGLGGSQFKSGQDGVLDLHEGKIAALTGNDVIQISTDMGMLSVPAESAVIVDHKQSHILKVLNLSGGVTQFAVSHNGNTKNFSSAPGEALIVADASVSQEDLIDAAGETQPIGGKIAIADLTAVGDLNVAKQPFDRSKYLPKEPLLNCPEIRRYDPIKRRIAKLKQEIDQAVPVVGNQTPSNGSPSSMIPAGKGMRQSPISQSDSNAIYNPVSFQRGNHLGTMNGVTRTLSNENADIKYTGDTTVSLDRPDLIKLTHGEVLIEARKKTYVKCHDLTIAVQPGSIALVSSAGDLVKVRDLYADTKDGVTTYVDQKSMSSASGCELIWAPHANMVTSELRQDHIARRQVRIIGLPHDHGASRAEVSIVSVIANTPLLRSVANSSDYPDRTIGDKIVKMAACLSQVTNSHGPYSAAGK